MSMSSSSKPLAAAENAATTEQTERRATVGTKAESKDDVGVEQPDFQVRRPDTLLFATIEGLQKQSGVSKSQLRRLLLKELADNGLDAADAAGLHGQVEIERLDENRYRVTDQDAGMPGTPEDLAKLFALGRPMCQIASNSDPLFASNRDPSLAAAWSLSTSCIGGTRARSAAPWALRGAKGAGGPCASRG